MPEKKIQKITVYLGANEGTDPRLKAAVRELGSWIGASGRSLVYGGSKCGLMGELAESVLKAGGKVIGVEPRFFVEAGLVYDAIDELIVTENMAERKARMLELGDAFIAFPGGTGTLEEILTPENMRDVFSVDGELIVNPKNGLRTVMLNGSVKKQA